MAYERADDYVVLTHDLDFGAILAATHGEKPSVVQIRADEVSPDVIGKQVIVALRQMASDLEEGALLTIDPNRTRLRLLPLQSRGGRHADRWCGRVDATAKPGSVDRRLDQGWLQDTLRRQDQQQSRRAARTQEDAGNAP
jgi:hypothetical protein